MTRRPGKMSGVAAVNDLTARDLQRSDSQWTRAKGLDTLCPVGTVVHASSVDPAASSLAKRLNAQVRQRGTTAEVVFFIPRLARPEGVGPMSPGD